MSKSAVSCNTTLTFRMPTLRHPLILPLCVKVLDSTYRPLTLIAFAVKIIGGMDHFLRRTMRGIPFRHPWHALPLLSSFTYAFTMLPCAEPRFTRLGIFLSLYLLTHCLSPCSHSSDDPCSLYPSPIQGLSRNCLPCSRPCGSLVACRPDSE